MTECYISKSGYCRALRCPKMFWLDRRKPEEKAEADNTAALETGAKAGELARQYFGEYALVEYNENKQRMLAETQGLIQRNATEGGVTPAAICEASFAHQGSFCAIDILRAVNSGYEIVEVKSTATMKDIYLDDMAFQYHVLSSCGLAVKKTSLMHINSAYVRQGELDLQQLFTLHDCTETVRAKQPEVAANLERFSVLAASPAEPDIPPNKECPGCDYNAYCFRSSPQIESAADTALHIDRPAIKEFLDTLRWPLYFLDFETFRDVIPAFDRQRPYQQVPFQYSLHIQSSPGAECEHREFLAEAGTDPRRAIAKRLCTDIPKNACVLAYYMPFEKGRIQELADTFPDLGDHLMSIHGNIQDLIIPFKRGAYHHPAQGGSNSIKAVLPALFPNEPELDYAALDLIHNGGEAMDAFPALPGKSPEEQEKIRAALLAYCRLDTLAMVKILEKLRRAVDGSAAAER